MGNEESPGFGSRLKPFISRQLHRTIMKQKLSVLLLVGAFGATLSAQEAKQMTVDQLVAKNVEAKGGNEALHALQTVKLTGRMLVNEGQLAFGYSQTKKRPGAVRTEYTLQGMTMVQAF